MASEVQKFGVLGAVSTSGPGHVEANLESSKRTSKTLRKRYEGTEGIDAADEREESDRFAEGFSMMSEGNE